ADLHPISLDRELHLLAMAHDVFVDGVIEHLLHQDVTAVVLVRAIADAPDVHARAETDVFERRERLDLALVVNVLFIVSHTLKISSREYQAVARRCNWKVWNAPPPNER